MVGCAKPDINVTDANGNNVKVSSDGTKMTSTDKDGKTTTIETGATTGSVSVKDEKGTTTAETGTSLSEADLGIGFYPGSTEKTGVSAKSDTPDGKSAMSVRTSTDEPTKVAEFYKGKVKEANVMSMGDATHDVQMVTGKLESGGTVTVSASREKGKTETDINVTTVIPKKK